MKSLFQYPMLAMICLMGTSCMSSYQSVTPESRLSSIPTRVHGKEVEVFFPGERPSDTAYVKVAVLEEKAEGEVAYAKLVEQLKQKARLQGMDALLLLGKNQSTRLKSDEGLLEALVEIASGDEIEDNYYSVTTHELSGVGIKYKKNLQYLPEYVQSKRVYTLENGQETLLATISVDHQGRDKNVATLELPDQHTYKQYVQRYDLNHLLKEEGPNWYFKAEAGQVKKRRLLSGNGSGVIKTILITYNQHQLPQRLEIRSPAIPVPEMIYLSYNPQKQVTEKVVYRGKELYLKETNTYDSSGKLESTLHERVMNRIATPFLKTVYDYYPVLSLN